MIVRHPLPITWKCLLVVLEDLRVAFPEKMTCRNFRFNRRMIAIDSRRRPL